MNYERQDFLNRLQAFFNKDWEKAEMNDYESIKEELIKELRGLI